MNDSKKFDPAKLARLNDPKRLEYLNIDVIWGKALLANPKVLIDIGAGTAFFALHFSKKIKNGKVYACDISEKMLVWMNDNLPIESKGVVIAHSIQTEPSFQCKPNPLLTHSEAGL